MALDGFAVVGNHFHLALCHDPKASGRWRAETVARRHTLAFPPRDPDGAVAEERLAEVEEVPLDDEAGLARAREILGSLSWFMQHLKHPISGASEQGRWLQGTLLGATTLLAAAARHGGRDRDDVLHRPESGAPVSPAVWRTARTRRWRCGKGEYHGRAGRLAERRAWEIAYGVYDGQSVWRD